MLISAHKTLWPRLKCERKRESKCIGLYINESVLYLYIVLSVEVNSQTRTTHTHMYTLT